jgi:hypothetical protein
LFQGCSDPVHSKLHQYALVAQGMSQTRRPYLRLRGGQISVVTAQDEAWRAGRVIAIDSGRRDLVCVEVSVEGVGMAIEFGEVRKR